MPAPDTVVNLEYLALKIEEATREAFTEICEACGPEDLYAFALYSDEDAMIIFPVANTLGHLLKQAGDDNYLECKFDMAGWDEEINGAAKAFESISGLLRAMVSKRRSDREWFSNFREALHATCINVLDTLRQECFFEHSMGKEPFLFFFTPTHGFGKPGLIKLLTRLNGKGYCLEYLDWMECRED